MIQLGGDTVNTDRHFLRISFNSPVILWFSILCMISLVLNWLTGGITNLYLFSVYRSSLTDPLSYFRMFGHVLGHADIQHFLGNITFILVVGPLLEEKYGSSNLFVVIFITSIVTGLTNFVFFPGVQLLGASGVVFAFILLSSITCSKNGYIPLTFILVALIYIGEQVYSGLMIHDNVSQLTHILGGGVGSAMGFIMNKYKMNRY